MTYSLENLVETAKNYQITDLPISFSEEPYTRTPIYRDDNLEIVLICFSKGQTSSIHDHQGSNCVIRVMDGKLLEFLFDERDGKYYHKSHHYLGPGQISGLDGEAVHQLANVAHEGTVILNFYSPPFKI
jgi:cysteine dioxygenase